MQGIERGSGTYHDFLGDHHRNYIDFRLDGVTYRAVENPDDGYRSYCEELQIVDSVPRTTLPDIEVIGTMMPNDDYMVNDVLILIDAVTGKPVLEIGTKNTDDYYPYCWMEYHPENMICNQLP